MPLWFQRVFHYKSFCKRIDEGSIYPDFLAEAIWKTTSLSIMSGFLLFVSGFRLSGVSLDTTIEWQRCVGGFEKKDDKELGFGNCKIIPLTIWSAVLKEGSHVILDARSLSYEDSRICVFCLRRWAGNSCTERDKCSKLKIFWLFWTLFIALCMRAWMPCLYMVTSYLVSS